jgi:hypothetical protein
MLCDLVHISGIAREDAAIIFKVQQIEDKCMTWINVGLLAQCV